MAKLVVGMFGSMQNARDAVDELVNSGIDRNAISLITSDDRGEFSRHLGGLASTSSDETGADISDSAATGAGVGAVLGGIGGLLVGLGALAIPGIGPVIAAGPIVAALSGAGVGAATGAVTGGLLGALVDMGIPDERARIYQNGIRQGNILVTVQVDDEIANTAVQILNRHAPIDVNQKSQEWAQFYQEGATNAGGEEAMGGYTNTISQDTPGAGQSAPGSVDTVGGYRGSIGEQRTYGTGPGHMENRTEDRTVNRSGMGAQGDRGTRHSDFDERTVSTSSEITGMGGVGSPSDFGTDQGGVETSHDYGTHHTDRSDLSDFGTDRSDLDEHTGSHTGAMSAQDDYGTGSDVDDNEEYGYESGEGPQRAFRTGDPSYTSIEGSLDDFGPGVADRGEYETGATTDRQRDYGANPDIGAGATSGSPAVLGGGMGGSDDLGPDSPDNHPFDRSENESLIDDSEMGDPHMGRDYGPGSDAGSVSRDYGSGSQRNFSTGGDVEGSTQDYGIDYGTSTHSDAGAPRDYGTGSQSDFAGSDQTTRPPSQGRGQSMGDARYAGSSGYQAGYDANPDDLDTNPGHQGMGDEDTTNFGDQTMDRSSGSNADFDMDRGEGAMGGRSGSSAGQRDYATGQSDFNAERGNYGMGQGDYGTGPHDMGSQAGTTGTQRDYGAGSSYGDDQAHYDYGARLHEDPTYRGRQWNDIELEVRNRWETANPDTPWERIKDAIRRGWDSLTGGGQ